MNILRDPLTALVLALVVLTLAAPQYVSMNREHQQAEQTRRACIRLVAEMNVDAVMLLVRDLPIAPKCLPYLEDARSVQRKMRDLREQNPTADLSNSLEVFLRR